MQLNDTNYILINYLIKRMKKETFDSKTQIFDFDTNNFQTKLKNKLIDHKNKNKNQILNQKLIYIEHYDISIQNLFKTMVKDINIYIPLRFNDKNVNLLTINSNLLKWGTIKQVKISNINYLKWSLKFIKGNGKHSIKLQCQFIANHKKYIPPIINNEKYTNITDSKIKCEWNKEYFSTSNMKIEKYYVQIEHDLNVTSWIKMVTNNKLTIVDDEEKQEEEEEDTLDMSFLNQIKTMNSSIITYDKRISFSKFQTIYDIKWRENIKKDNLIKYIKNQCYIDIEENEMGGIVTINNEISGYFNIFRICLKMKDELLIIKNYHQSLFLVEYKLKKLTINNESIYGYLYYFYTFSLPFGKTQLFKYKRILNKKQSIPNLITLKCNKCIIENDDDNNNNDDTEWIENYKLKIQSNFNSNLIANNINLSIPVYINDINRNNISIKSMSSSTTAFGDLFQIQQNKGKLKYIELEDCISWNLTNFKGKDEISRNIQFKLHRNDDQEEELGINNNKVLVFGECEINSIEIANYSLSGIIVSGLKLLNKTKLSYDVWIRYNTICNNKSL